VTAQPLGRDVIDGREVEHREQGRQLSSHTDRLFIVQVAEQPRAVDGAERLHLDELR
jgi:hypothetical protein